MASVSTSLSDFNSTDTSVALPIPIYDNNSRLAEAVSRCTRLEYFSLQLPYLRDPNLSRFTDVAYVEISELLRAVPPAVTHLELLITDLPLWYPCVPILDIMFGYVGWNHFAQAIMSRRDHRLEQLTVHLDVPILVRDWQVDRMLDLLQHAFGPYFSQAEGAFPFILPSRKC